VTKGVYMSGGTIDFFYETLAAFRDDAEERKTDLVKSLDAGDLPLYTTYIHALRSASANVGADHLFEAAYALEMAGQRGDTEYIKVNNDRFITDLEHVLKNIDAALAPSGANGDTRGLMLSDQNRDHLIGLKSALGRFDFEGINKTVNTLLATVHSEDLKTAIRNISKHILIFEYNEAEDLIDDLMNKAN
jgi:HPt (histidine-containing phosphotransfer) domain-containing protein